MRTLLSLVFVFIFLNTSSQDESDPKLKTTANVSLNSNGIASIPAFSLGKPAVIASVSLAKNRFSFDPVLAYSLDMKPWFIDSWLHYKILNRPKVELRTGFNFSNFFSSFRFEDETILKGERYFAYELAVTRKFTSNSTLSFMYWRDMGQEPGTISGHFFNLVAEKNDIKIGENVLIAATLQLFMINYDGNNDGLFVSPKISFTVRNVPFALFWQATQVLSSNISPNPGFKWNLGLAYTL